MRDRRSPRQRGRGVKARAEAALADAQRVARFFRGLWEFRVRPDDVFISSYPRSGTTWMQHILHVLRSGGDTSFQHISEVVPWFERPLALGRQRALDYDALPSPRIFKSHLPRAWLPRGARYVYVERDGRDVAISYYHFYRSHLGYTASFDTFFELFMAGALQYGSWFRHVAGWRAHTNDPAVLIVQYERLQSDLPHELQRLAAFISKPLDGAAVQQLGPLCGFQYMREHETKFDHASAEPGARTRQPGAFIRRGQSGGFASLLNDSQRRQFSLLAARPLRAAIIELNLPAFLC